MLILNIYLIRKDLVLDSHFNEKRTNLSSFITYLHAIRLSAKFSIPEDINSDSSELFFAGVLLSWSLSHCGIVSLV